MTVHAPVDTDARLSHIDMVRGYALLGVLLMNIHYWFRNPPQPYWLGGLPFSGGLDLAVHRVLQIGFEAKSVTMFSFLFALGLCIQRERILEKGLSWGAYASRRMLAMLLFGGLHILLVWNGDVLHMYAIIGLTILPFLGRKQKTLAWWIGVIVGLALVGILIGTVRMFLKGPPPPDAGNPKAAELWGWAAACVRNYAQASWWTTLKFRLQDYRVVMINPQMLGFVVFTFFNFLVGVWLWKQGAVREPARHRRTFGRIATVLLLLGLMAGAVGAFRLPLQAFLRAHWSSGRYLLPLMGLLQIFGAQIMALGLGSGLLWLWEGPAGRRFLRPLADVGRMAFTNYILQSLVCTFVFYGWGLGLYNKVGPAVGTAFGLALFGLQIPFSRWWLRRFRFGPLEWAWRSLTYGEAQPFSRPPTEAPVA
jgi:uncharacterized protein